MADRDHWRDDQDRYRYRDDRHRSNEDRYRSGEDHGRRSGEVYRREGSGFGHHDRGHERNYGREDYRAQGWGRGGRDEFRGGGPEEFRPGGRGGFGPDSDREHGRESRGYESQFGREGYGRSGYEQPWRRESWDDRGRTEDYSRGYGYGQRSSWQDNPYGRSGQEAYGREYSGRRGGEDRGWWDRASDEVSSWFGDQDAERRRREDERRDQSREQHRGRGPRGYSRSDDRIREDVNDRLTDHPAIDASDVEVNVSNGEVTLSGQVDSRHAKRLAEDIAEQVPGVKHLQNNLRVRQQGQFGQQHSAVSGGTSATGTSGLATASTGTALTGGTTSGSAGVETSRTPTTSGAPSQQTSSGTSSASGLSGAAGTSRTTGSS